MTLALIILAGISALIFIFSYGRIVVASFQHHVITGLISFLPGVNLVVLPSVWDKIGRAFFTSIFALGFAALTWFSGGNKYVEERGLIASSTPVKTQAEGLEENTQAPHSILGSIKEVDLPAKALRHFVFVDVPKQKYNDVSNEYLRIILSDDSIIEGQSSKITGEAVTIKERFQGKTRIQQINIANIKKLQSLVTKN